MPLFAFWFFYFVIAETWYGATAGHKLFDLKVLTTERKEIGFSHALKRRIPDFIDLFIYSIPAFITVKNTEKHQRIDDLLAKTIVIDTGDPEQTGINDQ